MLLNAKSTSVGAHEGMPKIIIELPDRLTSEMAFKKSVTVATVFHFGRASEFVSQERSNKVWISM